MNEKSLVGKRAKKKQFLTTGEAAQYCGVNFRTVIRWVERGYLKAYQLPGRGDRRIEVKDFIEFLKKNRMSIPDTFLPLEASRTKQTRDKQGKKSILIVDNEPPVARAIQRALRKTGFRTEVALDGFQAGYLLNLIKPDVMTLDLRMPGMGGLDVLETLRLSKVRTKVIVVSGDSDEKLREALNAGADAVIAKPFENRELVEKVYKLLGARISEDVVKKK